MAAVDERQRGGTVERGARTQTWRHGGSHATKKQKTADDGDGDGLRPSIDESVVGMIDGRGPSVDGSEVGLMMMTTMRAQEKESGSSEGELLSTQG